MSRTHAIRGARKLPAVLAAVVALTAALPAAAQLSVFVYRGELSQPSASPEDTWFKEVELADVDNDGWLDVVLPQKQPCPPPCEGNLTLPGPNIDHLYLGPPGLILALDSPAAAFTFRPTSETFPLIATTRNYDVELADLDLDGVLDIIRPDRFGNLKVLWGRIDGGTGEVDFLQFTDVLSPQFGGNPNDECAGPDNIIDGNYDDVDAADLDFDGDTDFVVAQFDTCGRNFLVENLTKILVAGQVFDGTPRTFQIRGVGPDELPADRTHSVSLGFVDGDASFDVLLANTFLSSSRPQLYFGAGNPFDFLAAAYELDQPGLNAWPTPVADLRDLNGDGKTDAYVSQYYAGTGQAASHGVYFHSGNDGDPYPTFTPWPQASPSLRLYDARYGDLDLDPAGTIEIVTVNINVTEPGDRFDTEVRVASVQGTQLVEVSDLYVPAALSGGIGIDLGDLDNDGDLDMVLAGISADPGGIYSAAHVYENRTLTRFDRTFTSGQHQLIALDTLTAGDGAEVSGSGDVSLLAPTVVLADGFTAAPGVGGSFRAGPLP